MKRLLILKLAIFFTMLSQSESFATQVDTIKLPPINWSRAHQIDVKHIVINLRFDWQKKQAFGTALLTCTSFNTTDIIYLDAGNLTINSVSLSNGTKLKYEYDGSDKNDGLKIFLNKEYYSSDEIKIKIDYKTNWINNSDPNNLWGSFGKGIRFFDATTIEPKKRKQIWSNGEAESNRYWFPCYDAPNDLRTTEFIATVDSNFTVIANGTLIDSSTNKDNTKTFHYKTDIPYANHLTSFVIGEFVDVPQNLNTIKIHNYGYKEELDAVKASVVRLPDMMQYFSDVTGINYPYKNYTQVFVQDFAGFAGNNTMSTITENMIDDERTHNDFYYLWDLTEAESLAQQWFGNALSCADWSEIWLNKSFAHYMNELYNEHKNGKDEFLLYQLLYDQNTVYLGDWDAGYKHPVVTKNYDDKQTFVSDNYSATRGALVLHMLRKYLGDTIWFKAIKLYTQTNYGKLVATQDFQKAIEEASGEPMDWFFDQWIYKMGHPIFEITKQYDVTKKQLMLQVSQIQKIDSATLYPQVNYFKGKVEIAIDDKIVTVWIEDKVINTYTFSSEQEPKLVHFDVESTWIKELKFEKSTNELIYQLINDKDILARNWALNELVTIAKNPATAIFEKEKIYAAFRTVVLSNTYWRLRATVLTQLRNLIISSTVSSPIKLDQPTTQMLLSIIKNENAWLKTSALIFLGNTKDKRYVPIYINALNDESDRVINAAATALGKTKNPKAFDVLSRLVNKPSWKNQSLISALNGLKELGDAHAYAIAYKALTDLEAPHWTLATPVWDFRITAAETINSLGKSELAFPYLFDAFKKSMDENDIHGIFYNVLLISKLSDERGKEIFVQLRNKFKNNVDILSTVEQYEAQFMEFIKK